MLSIIASAGNPVTHAVPHRIGDEVFSVNTGGGDIPALNIYDGVYRFFVTNHLIMSLVSAIAVILVFWFVSRRVRVKGDDLSSYQTRGRFSQLFETMCSFIRDEVARPNLHGLTDKYIYYIWTIFFFVLFANVLGLIPFGSIIYMITGNPHHTHLGGTATGNLSLNLVLAMGSFIAIVFIGIRETGAKAFFSHFNPIGWDNPAMLPIGILLYFLEWLGLGIKCVVLAMRLFGTMMAGHLVIAAFIGLIYMAREVSNGLAYGVQLSVIGGGIVLTLLELFICFLQAFIFTFLTVLFISLVASHHDHEHHEEEDPFSDEGQMDLDKLISPERITPMADPAS
ncbi:ATP synthase subunit a [Rubripirellula amarantea]|uniref:ATP synthase subunit a n=1 Tax=Rubripirellula amarantea TaxID=2527999 RepID=A0A5C5WGD0_9BACT|nr:F0F1 ATP synthase subunit A [Rubripirellula amarantea]TWT49710.1 ATP synthase subunit a [Rubripirellula amarantea]